jgi:hypothetical protein
VVNSSQLAGGGGGGTIVPQLEIIGISYVQGMGCGVGVQSG